MENSPENSNSEIKKGQYTMRVLHIINSLMPGGGAEQLLGDLLPALKKRGIEPRVVTLYKYDDSQIEQKLLDERIYVDRINSLVRYNPFILFYLQNAARKGNFNIIHSHLFPSQYYGSMLVPNSKTALITTEHNILNKRRKNKLFRPLEYKVYSKYDKILCISNAVAYSLNVWIPGIGERIEVIYNGRDLTNFNSAVSLKRPEIGVSNAVPLVIAVSSLSQQKDYNTLIKAIKKLPGVHLLVVGQGPLKNSLMKLAVDLGVGERIHFLGHRNDVAQLIKTADVFTQSSHWEGFGLTVVEAMACGVPVIATNVPGVNEVIVDGVSGILVPPKDENALAASISAVLSNEHLSNKLRMNGLERAKKFSIDTMADEVTNIYRKALARIKTIQ